MELRQLDHFVVLAEELHFTRAAARLHIVQSALSASIRALESDLGTPLFHRSTKQVRLTEAGRALVPEARRTLRAAAVARESVAAVQGVTTGRLVVGFMQASHSYDLPELLRRFHTAHPKVQLRLRQAPSTELIEGVRTAQLDLAFVGLSGRAPAGVSVRTLSVGPMPLACPLGHRFAAAAPVPLADVAGEPFVDFVPGWGARTSTDELFRAAGLQRLTAFEVNDIPLFTDLVEQGLGVGFVPPGMAAATARLEYVAVDPAPTWRVAVAHPPREQLSAAARAMLDLIG
ncbi:LysR family transcriptional regulator [Jiangella aurantiaca]|uniref:LysR family transcriptional regulator n=1 Tax=Jiangella aurantiaca TaxID=2530373 RepID=A0A4R5A945_9ACTN|nr:LysR family transcriptional regulator [Jiangella aurantiaca]TDD67389.1 LysR family transcriptional regulator [Jiangella aurantiaca]